MDEMRLLIYQIKSFVKIMIFYLFFRFIFRGEKLEQWNSFKQGMLSNYFDFKFIDNMEDCDLFNAEGKFIQVRNF